MLSQDPEKSTAIASEVEAINAQRQEIVEEVFGSAKQMALSDEYKNDQVLVIAGQDWHQGILGIVASRLVELLQKPTIVLSVTDGVYKGSGRTFGDFDLYQFMNTFHDLYDTFGGHASALGLAIFPEQLDVLKEQVRLNSAKLQSMPSRLVLIRHCRLMKSALKRMKNYACLNPSVLEISNQCLDCSNQKLIK